MYSFALALLVNPNVQAKGQAEIDAIVGTDRLPMFEDRPQMPYIEAILSESLRWLPTVPLGEAMKASSLHKSLNSAWNQASRIAILPMTNIRVTTYPRAQS